jgi:hypothetical protein
MDAEALDPEPWTSWSRYCDWRITKSPDRDRRPPTERMDQATHEVVGAYAELMHQVGQAGSLLFRDDRARQALLSEAGDVFFGAAWLMDAWGYSVLRALSTAPTVELISAAEKAELDRHFGHFRDTLAGGPPDAPDDERRLAWRAASNQFEWLAITHLYRGMMLLGQTCHLFTTHVYRRQPQLPDQVADWTIAALCSVASVLHLVGLSVEDALRANVAKLDARFPNGRVPGGGHREGDGQ